MTLHGAHYFFFPDGGSLFSRTLVPLPLLSSAVYAIATNRDPTHVGVAQERGKEGEKFRHHVFYVIVCPYQIRYPTSWCGNTGF